MAIYSHSKITTFENCPYQYKLKYIDKKEVEISTTIEAFLGDIVHKTLEKLYKNKKFMKKVTKSSLIKFYKELWTKGYSKDILVVKSKEGLTSENYRKMGEKFILNYYNRMKPFNQMTILDLETQDQMTLPDGNQWHVRIDKLGCDKEGNYYICDYKTNSKMKDQEEADSDRQLAMYSIWVRDKFKDAKKIKLIWHMLAFDKDIISERSNEQLKKLQEEIAKEIKEIENAKEFPRKVTALCDYCVYKEICPSFKHKKELEKLKTVEKFKKDEGVKLVDMFSEVKSQLVDLNKKDEELKEKLISYGKQFGFDKIYGSNKIASIKEYDKIVLPENREELIRLMKKKGIYEDFLTLNYMKLNSSVIKGSIDKEIKNKVDIAKDWRISLSQRKDIEDEN